MNFPERVYHYTKREIALEHILPSKRIWLGSLGSTNDPRETTKWDPSIGAPGDHEPPLTQLVYQVLESYNLIRVNEWWALCLSRDDPNLGHDPDKRYLTEFRRGYARARMWAHYAQSHEGICLEFDGPSLHRAIVDAVGDPNSVFHGDVEYGDELNLHKIGPKGGETAFHIYLPNLEKFDSIEEGVRAHILKYHRTFFLEKAADWSSEFEYRWLVHRIAAHRIEVDIGKALRSVIVGNDFPLVYEPTVRQLCNELGIGLDKIVWNNRVPRREPWRILE